MASTALVYFSDALDWLLSRPPLLSPILHGLAIRRPSRYISASIAIFRKIPRRPSMTNSFACCSSTQTAQQSTKQFSSVLVTHCAASILWRHTLKGYQHAILAAKHLGPWLCKNLSGNKIRQCWFREGNLKRRVSLSPKPFALEAIFVLVGL